MNLSSLGSHHRQQNRYSPQVALGKLFKDYSYSFWLCQESMNVTVTAPGGIPRARMNHCRPSRNLCAYSLPLQIPLVPTPTCVGQKRSQKFMVMKLEVLANEIRGGLFGGKIFVNFLPAEIF